MPKEKRPLTIKFRVSEQEHRMIQERMEHLGIVSNAAYLRKMALNGYILTFNMPELHKAITFMGSLSNNINQLTKRVNATVTIYQSELDEIQTQQQRLWELLNDILIRLGKKL